MKKYFIKPGDRFGMLTVISEESRKEKGVTRRYVKVRCDCGNELEVIGGNLFKGNHTTSCGCYARKVRSELSTTHGHSRRDGGNKNRTYRCWEAMKQRCFNPNNDDYWNYGQRGITVCERWKNSFENFLADMGECPADRYIDRIDNDKGYEPSNCRWADALQQVYNRRCTKRVEYEGKMYTLRELSNMTGFSYDLLDHRLTIGFTVKEAVETPKGKRRAECKTTQTNN